MAKIEKNPIRFLPRVLILMSLMLAAVTCAKAIKYKIETDGLPSKIKSALGSSGQNEEEIKKLQERFKMAAGKLKEKSIFSPPKPGKSNPVKKVLAILGDEALINNKWYKAGDSIGDAKLILVGFAEIVVEWNGKETKLSPIAAPTKYAVVAKPKAEKKAVAVKAESVEVVKEEAVKAEAVAVVDDDPFSWVGVKMSPELKAKMIEQWNKMTDEQKAKAKEKWENMPDSQKETTVAQMELHKDKM